MKIILIESSCGIYLLRSESHERGLNGSLLSYQKHTFWAALLMRDQRKIAKPVVDMLDVPGCSVFKLCVLAPETLQLFYKIPQILRNIPKLYVLNCVNNVHSVCVHCGHFSVIFWNSWFSCIVFSARIKITDGFV